MHTGNAGQELAIRHGKGPCLVLAGPGSGKTFVLVQRIDNLIRNHNIPPDQILVLTFSRAAARQMQSRFSTLEQEKYQGVVFGTFHSVFYSFLRDASPVPLRVIPAEQQAALIRHLVETLEVPRNQDSSAVFEAAVSAISFLKIHRGEDPEQYSVWRQLRRVFSAPDIPVRIFREYSDFLEDRSLLDYGDMIVRCEELLKNNPELLDSLQNRYRYLLVDEFQDISPVQYNILRMLTGEKERNLFVVGDDDQAIYGFRGAEPGLCRRFLTDFPDAEQVFLRINYRCSGRILDAAGRVIAENHDRFDKNLTAYKAAGSDPVILPCSTAVIQRSELAERIRSMSPERQQETAILVRSHASMPWIRRALENYGIPCRRPAGTADHKKQEIFRIIEAYYICAEQMTRRGTQTASRAAFYRIMNLPERYLCRAAVPAEGVSFAALRLYYHDSPPMLRTIRRMEEDLSLLVRIRPALSLRFLLCTMGLEDALLLSAGPQKQEEVREILSGFRTAVESAGSVSEMLDRLRTLAEAPLPGLREGVQIMTMHASKGLEFTTVILPDLNEGILPCRQASDPAQIEEERRLLYVAMTRAREELILLYVSGTRENPLRPSRFLAPLGVTASY